jgi:osmotically-inducible protein OsmY
MKTLVLCLALTLSAAEKKVSDDEIYDQVRRVLANDSEVRGGAFDVEVKDGVVTVKGKVDRENVRKKVDKLVKKVKGVSEVNNQVRVAP